MYGAWGSRQSCLALADLVNLETRMASFGIRETNAIFEESVEIPPSNRSKEVRSQDLSTLRSPPSPQPPLPPRPLQILRESSFCAQDRGSVSRHAFVYCDRVTRRSWECESVKSPAERKGILQSKC